MVCKFCRKPVYFHEKNYVKFALPDKEVFYHLDCYKTSLDAKQHQDDVQPLDSQIAV